LAIKQKTIVPIKIEADCPTHSRSDISVRDVSTTIDEPIERGGTNLGLSPTETLVASLVGCTAVIGRKCAAKLEIDVGHLAISAVCQFDRRGVLLMEEIDMPFTHVQLNIETSGTATPAQLTRLGAEVAKFCPVSKLFRQAGVQVEDNWMSKSETPESSA